MIQASKTPKFKPARFTSAEWLMIQYAAEEATRRMQKKIEELIEDFIQEPGVADLPYRSVFENDWKYVLEGEATSLDGVRRIIDFVFEFQSGSLDKGLTYTRHISSGAQVERGIDKPIEIISYISNELPLRFLLTHEEEIQRSLIINIGHEFNHFKNTWLKTQSENKIQQGVQTGESSFRDYVNAPSEFTSRLNQILVQMTLENNAGGDILRRHWNVTPSDERMDYIYDLLARNEEWHVSGKIWSPENKAKVIRAVIWFLNGGEIFHDRQEKQISPRERSETSVPNIRLRKTPRKNVHRKTIDMLPYEYPRRKDMRHVLEPGETRDMFNPEQVKRLTEIEN